MDEDEPTERVLARLKNGDNPEDILFELCESTDMDWREAKTLVERIRAENKTSITLYQSPLLITLALAIFLGGAGLIVYTTVSIVTLYDAFQVIPPDLILLPQFFSYIWYLTLYAPYLIAFFVLGLGMMLGSAIGMQAVWEAIFAKLGIFQGTE